MIFFLSSQKTGFDVSFKLSPFETICIKQQILDPWKIRNKTKFKMSSAYDFSQTANVRNKCRRQLLFNRNSFSTDDDCRLKTGIESEGKKTFIYFFTIFIPTLKVIMNQSTICIIFFQAVTRNFSISIKRHEKKCL